MTTRSKIVRQEVDSVGTRSRCPVAAALDLIGDKWTMLVIRDLCLGRKRFAEFQEAGEGIPTNLLAARLKRLERHGIVTRQLYRQNPPRYEYLLTESGNELRSVLKPLALWGVRFSPDPTGAAKRLEERLYFQATSKAAPITATKLRKPLAQPRRSPNQRHHKQTPASPKSG